MSIPVREHIATRTDDNDDFSAKRSTYYNHLIELFRSIDEGDPSIGLPPYNGGLFDPRRTPILERSHLSDAVLAPVIDALSRHDEHGQKRRINYRDLSVRHLGSIYEQLLENEVSEHDGEVIVGGDGDARHGSGTYYTPEAPVQLIIHKAVGPLVSERLSAFQAKADELASDTRAKKERVSELHRLDPALRILEIKVCDPAMGSGHFLVSLVDYLADHVLDAMAESEAFVTWATYTSPLADVIADTRQHILEQAQAGGWPVEEAQLEDRLIVRRMILKRVIYGVDKNPMAVELAKVSLWLHTFTVGAPLSFLEHHLRCGDSICGEWIREVEDELAAQGNMFLAPSVAKAKNTAKKMAAIERLTDADIMQVKESSSFFDSVEEATRPLSRFLNFVHALRWLNKRDKASKKAIQELLDGQHGDPVKVVGNDNKPPKDETARNLLEEALSLANAEHFLHWEVAFPGVWDDWESTETKGGFDAVIGNPPYVRQELIKNAKDFLKHRYQSFDGAADLYVYFYEQGLRLLRPGGRLSLIVTNKWMRAGYAGKLRKLFAEEAWMESVVDFGHAKQIFPHADVFPCVVVARRPAKIEPSPATTRVCIVNRDELQMDALIEQVEGEEFEIPRARLRNEGWNLEPVEVLSLIEKINNLGEPLTAFAGAKPFRGVVTGFNDAFLIDTPTRDKIIRKDGRSAEIIKPFFRGQDVGRWTADWAGLWMIFTRRGVDISLYPAVEEHLAKFRHKLEPKPKNWAPSDKNEKWEGRKEGVYKWYEIQDSIDYWMEFDKPKIIYQEIQFHPSYCYEEDKFLGNNKIFFLPSSDLYLLGVLNTPLIWWFNWRYLPHMKDEALSPVGFKMETLPIAKPSRELRSKIETKVSRLVEITKQIRTTQSQIGDWLGVEFGVSKPGRALQETASLSSDEFVAEVRKARGTSNKLTPAALAELRQAFADTIEPARQLRIEANALEHGISDLVNEAYGLTNEEVELMWQTAPPRMPLQSPLAATKDHEDESSEETP